LLVSVFWVFPTEVAPFFSPSETWVEGVGEWCPNDKEINQIIMIIIVNMKVKKWILPKGKMKGNAKDKQRE
jgi:hypothetical protein